MDRECPACKVTIATDGCTHVSIQDGQVRMSETEWRKITDELQRLRTLEGSLQYIQQGDML